MPANSEQVEKWQMLIKEYESSGLNVAKFCLSKGVMRTTFRYWLKKLRSKEKEKDKDLSKKSSFLFTRYVPLEKGGDCSIEDSQIVMRFFKDVTLSFKQNLSPAWVSKLLVCLEQDYK